MTSKISPIIDATALLAIKDDARVVLVDARSGPDIRSRYLAEHLSGARHADLDKQLSSVKANPAEGGRHPLPSPEAFADVIASLGISESSHVIVYDDKNAANAAARFWWMMRAAGHANVRVLDGGMDAAIKVGFPITSGEEPVKTVRPFKIKSWSMPLATIDDVEAAAADEDFKVIDVREKIRYDGITEPIDLVAGHIPGAINIPFATNLGANGLFLNPSELSAKYLEAIAEVSPEHVIVHCGSGVTACHTLLAMDYAGIEGARLYVGSWSEWSRKKI